MKTIIILSLLLSIPAFADESDNLALLQSQAWETQVKCNGQVDKSLPTNDKLFEFLKCFNKGMDVVMKEKTK